MPAGTIKPYTATLSGRDWATIIIPKKLIKPRGNVVAVEVHQVDAESSDMRFSAMLHAISPDQLTRPVAVRSDKKIIQITANGEALAPWQLTDVPIDFSDISRTSKIKKSEESNICFESAVDRACHRLKSGQTGVWIIDYKGKKYSAYLKR